MPKRKVNHDFRRSLKRGPKYGNKVSFSQRKTRRLFKTNVQWASIEVDGKLVRVQLTAKQIKAMCKTK